MKGKYEKIHKDVTLIGAGIMSATLSIMIKKLMPDAKIAIYEQLDKVGAESTDSWNNAGTGHSAFCELNYTPEQEDGSINIDKALEIASSFETSRQLWAHLKEKKHLPNDHFIKDVPHISFVWGEDNIAFLKKRHKALTQYALFEDMKYSDNVNEIASWVPLMMNNRINGARIAATKMDCGTDVNFDTLTQGMIEYMKSCEGVEVNLKHKVKNLTKERDGSWKIKVKDLNNHETKVIYSKFVFIGAGGGAIPLVQKSKIKEGKGYAGFPVSGQWLRCTNPEVIKQHSTKAYGKAEAGSPPMSMPHLDTRIIGGKRSLLFGPYAGISTKFLKTGSFWDLPGSIKLHNVWAMISTGVHNIPLIKYLIKQAFQTPKDRFKTLKKFLPDAKIEDWELVIAGQRVQIIKKDKKKGGVLQFGTEIINDSDGSLAALLGASPGASTSVNIALEVLDKCFPDKMATKEWKSIISEMIPSYGKSLINDRKLCLSTREATEKELELVE